MRILNLMRLVEYSKPNVALGDGRMSPQSRHPLGINYRPVQATRVTDVISHWQVDVRCPGVSSVCRHVQAQHIHCMLCLQMVI